MGQAVVIPPDSTETDYEDVDDFLFDTEGLDDEDADLGGYNPGVMWNSSRGGVKVILPQTKKEPLFSGSVLQFLYKKCVGLFYEVNDSFECLRIVHREVGEGFAVKLNALLC